MATNKKAEGNVIQWTNASGADIAAGAPVLMGAGGLAGIAIQDIANGASGSVAITGVWAFPVKGHDGLANAAVAAGAKVYYTAGEASCDVDSAATLLGYALSGVSSGATTTTDILLAAH